MDIITALVKVNEQLMIINRDIILLNMKLLMSDNEMKNDDSTDAREDENGVKEMINNLSNQLKFLHWQFNPSEKENRSLENKDEIDETAEQNLRQENNRRKISRREKENKRVPPDINSDMKILLHDLEEAEATEVDLYITSIDDDLT